MKLIMIRNKKFGDKKYYVGDVLTPVDIENIKQNLTFYDRLEHFVINDTTLFKIIRCNYGIKREDIDY